MSQDLQDHYGLDPALEVQRLEATVLPIDPRAIEWLLTCFCSSLPFFQEGRRQIRSHHFAPHEEVLAHTWQVMCQSVDETGGLSLEPLYVLMHQHLQQVASLSLGPQHYEVIFRRDELGLLWSLTHTPVTVDGMQLGRNILQKFLYERQVVRPLQRLLQPGVSNGYSGNIDTFLETVQRQRGRIMTASVIPRSVIAPARGTPIDPGRVFHLTGVPFIDGPLGGQCEGDCNGIVGVTGGGKTTLAVHMAVSTAMQCWAESLVTNSRPRLVVFITVEESAKKIKPRIWSTAAKIPVEKMATMGDWGILSDQGSLQDYERRLASKANAANDEVLSESERYDMIREPLTNCLELLDFSGSEEYPMAGQGYIPEIVSYLERLIDERQQLLSAVYIDWAGLLLSHYMSAHNIDESRMRPLLATLGDTARMQISERFKCTTWVTHQLKGEAAGFSPMKLMNHGDASESKAFATAMTVCGCLGVADRQTGCRYMNFSKVRYRSGDKTPPVVLKINDMFCEMEDVSGRYIVSESGRSFVTLEEARQVHGISATSERSLQMVGPAGMRNTSVVPNAIDPQVLGSL